MSEQMKAVVFEGVTYRVPVWVNWMARDGYGDIYGFEYIPMRNGSRYVTAGGRREKIYAAPMDESWRNSAARV